MTVQPVARTSWAQSAPFCHKVTPEQDVLLHAGHVLHIVRTYVLLSCLVQKLKPFIFLHVLRNVQEEWA